MCAGPELMALAQAGQGVSSLLAADTRGQMAKAEGAMQLDASRAQAKNILRETERRRGAARAATAASGARIDANSLANEQDILQAGETDAAMTILSGERAQRGKNIEAKTDMAKGLNDLGGSLFSAYGTLGNWRGAKFNGTNDFRGVSGSNAMDTWMKYGKGGD